MEVKPEALVQATFKFFQKNCPGPLLADQALSLSSQATCISQSIRFSSVESTGEKIEANDLARGGRGWCGTSESGRPQTEPSGIKSAGPASGTCLLALLAAQLLRWHRPGIWGWGKTQHSNVETTTWLCGSEDPLWLWMWVHNGPPSRTATFLDVSGKQHL